MEIRVRSHPPNQKRKFYWSAGRSWPAADYKNPVWAKAEVLDDEDDPEPFTHSRMGRKSYRALLADAHIEIDTRGDRPGLTVPWPPQSEHDYELTKLAAERDAALARLKALEAEAALAAEKLKATQTATPQSGRK